MTRPAYLCCTKCFAETDCTADDLALFGTRLQRDLALGWLCDDCLDEVEQEAVGKEMGNAD